MDTFEALRRSRDDFERKLRTVGPRDWDLPTPCTAWSVRDVANHVVGGCTRYTMLLHGAVPSQTDALRALDHLGTDPVASFRARAAEMIAAFDEPGALSRVVHHPAGDRSGAALLQMRVADFAIHAWDIARGVSSDERLDPDVIDWLWTILPAIIPELAGKGYFKAPERAPSPDATLQDRVLHLAGRQP